MPGNRIFRINDSLLTHGGELLICGKIGDDHTVVIPSSVSILSRSCFADRLSLDTVAFERDLRFQEIKEFAFSGSGLR
jgi:hypothetical protein